MVIIFFDGKESVVLELSSVGDDISDDDYDSDEDEGVVC